MCEWEKREMTMESWAKKVVDGCFYISKNDFSRLFAAHNMHVGQPSV